MNVHDRAARQAAADRRAGLTTTAPEPAEVAARMREAAKAAGPEAEAAVEEAIRAVFPELAEGR